MIQKYLINYCQIFELKVLKVRIWSLGLVHNNISCTFFYHNYVKVAV